MYCFGGNHRYRLFVIFRGNLGGNLLGNLRSNLGRNLGGNLGGNLGCKLWTEKNLLIFFWNSNPGQIDDFHETRLFSLSI